MRPLARLLAAFLLLLGTLPFAHADGIRIDSARFGGVWTNPSWLEGGTHAESDGFGVQGEVLFTVAAFEANATTGNVFLDGVLNPRLHVGGVLTLEDDQTDYAYAGLTWRWDLTQSLFVEFGFGGAVNNGELEGVVGRAELGSHVTFRESLSLGYRLTDMSAVVLGFEHLSHLRLASDRNRGLSNATLKYAIQF